MQTKGQDEESDATLLTALTEILDNVDVENLSPFDTLPDSDLLSGQKTRENSPVSAPAVRSSATYASQIPALITPNQTFQASAKSERSWKKKKLLTLVVLSQMRYCYSLFVLVCSSEDCSVCPVHLQKKKHSVMEDPHQLER